MKASKDDKEPCVGVINGQKGKETISYLYCLSSFSSLTVFFKNRDPVLLVDCQVPWLKLLQLAQVNLSYGGE